MLAFNVQGERFEPPAEATMWRVRRLKPGGRGTPDIIYGTDGAPLMLPLETELADFRAAVRNAPGRYRLDAVDDDLKTCQGSNPAYLQIYAGDSAPKQTEVTEQAAADSGSSDRALIEMLVRQNTEMVRSITERFASVMDSAAVLIRAADGAGMPSREPKALAEELAAAVRNGASAEAEHAEQTGNDSEPEQYNVAKEIIDTVKLGMPFVFQMAKDHRAKKQAAAQPAAPTAAPPPAAPRNVAPQVTAPIGDSNASPAAELPTREELKRKVLAVIKLLPPSDIGAAQAAILSMPEEEQTAWLTKLMTLTDEDAAAVVKAEIARRAAAAGDEQNEEAA